MATEVSIFFLSIGAVLVAGVLLLWQGKGRAASAAIGAAAGLFACFFVFQFRVAVSSFDAIVFFEPIWQRGGNALFQNRDLRTAETVANLLNGGLGLVGAAVGACIALAAAQVLATGRVSAR
jgi:hypothetical protein